MKVQIPTAFVNFVKDIFSQNFDQSDLLFREKIGTLANKYTSYHFLGDWETEQSALDWWGSYVEHEAARLYAVYSQNYGNAFQFLFIGNEIRRKEGSDTADTTVSGSSAEMTEDTPVGGSVDYSVGFPSGKRQSTTSGTNSSTGSRNETETVTGGANGENLLRLSFEYNILDSIDEILKKCTLEFNRIY